MKFVSQSPTPTRNSRTISIEGPNANARTMSTPQRIIVTFERTCMPRLMPLTTLHVYTTHVSPTIIAKENALEGMPYRKSRPVLI